MTLISFVTGAGTRRRCDATCHNALKPKCACVCGGAYHGKRAGSPELNAEIIAHGAETVMTMEAQGIWTDGLKRLLQMELPL